MKKRVICDYCGEVAKFVGGELIYPHRPDLHKLKFYQCKPCSAYVGVHKGSSTPLGRLANSKLRMAKSKAHIAFDPIWKQAYMSRSKAYIWLSESMGIDTDECHIGMFDEHQCEQVINLSEHKLTELY